MHARVLAWIGAAAVLAAMPASAAAQTQAVGLGPRFSFVRGDTKVDGSSARFSGGALRARVSRHSALELSIDWRSHINESLTERVKDYPLQGSYLLYPVAAPLSPYLLAGIGWYSQRIDTLSGDLVVSSSTTRKVGYHAGVGGELRLARHVGLHADYRYTFIRFGTPAEGTSAGAIPIPGLTSLQERLKLSHQGSMWTMGATVYF